MGNSNSLLNDARADILTVIFLSFRVINTVSFPPHRYLVYHQLSPDFTPVFYSVFITNLFVINGSHSARKRDMRLYARA